MGSRRQARECALQALYMCDSLDDWSKSALELFFDNFHPEFALKDGQEQVKNSAFAHVLVDGVIENRLSVDRFIGMASQNWTVGRMSRVDRNILRLGTFEICFLPDVPPNVSINEAIEVAKRFGADESPMFINGVLDRVAGDFKRGILIPTSFEVPVKKVINQ